MVALVVYESVFGNTRTVLTIHNLAYQGVYTPGSYDYLGLPNHLFNQVEFDGATDPALCVRWAQDAYYDQPGGFNRYLAYDVSMFGGVRAAWALRGVRMDAEYALEHRWNIFFQNDANNFLERRQGVRARNHMLRLRLTATAPRLGRAN